MRKRALGMSGIEMAPLMFGGNVFGWTADEKTSFALLDHFVAKGFDGVDTADVYSKWAPGHQGGESEIILGNWFALGGGRREKVVLATKCGMELAPDRKGLSAAWITRAAEDSLKRLKTDRIDLYQAHTDDQTVPLGESLEAFTRLFKAGKVRAIGASNYAAPRLAAALDASAAAGLPRYETLQPLYNLCARDFEKELAPLCLARSVGVIPYSSLASGFLTGKYRSEADTKGKARAAGVMRVLGPKGFQVLDAVEAVAKARGATPAQIALAWLLAKPAVTAPIASATSIAQLDELLGAVEIALDAAEVAKLDAAGV